ncbi:hypothetical protein GCM10022251_37600 [Phytohabitans flavus]|uniref:Uncharacterized protein n=1 Tax=Phytohabitans flavus TaxID=1076124 RepID=A0A6F8XVR6_9ACTN|nr:hypothetical protein Pflav_043360 [Phytohabitans flavus]
MNPSTSRRGRATVLVAVLAMLAALGASPSPAHAAPADPAGPVYTATDTLARQLASALRDRGSRDRVVSVAAAGPFDLATIGAGATFAASVRSANETVSAAKGLPGGVSLLRARLADPAMLPALRAGAAPLVAATPTDDLQASLVGYAPSGRQVRLDAARVPRRPVLLVEVDTGKALSLGVEVVRQRLGGAATLGAAPKAAANGYWATKIDAVHLNDDKEPWFKGVPRSTASWAGSAWTARQRPTSSRCRTSTTTGRRTTRTSCWCTSTRTSTTSPTS